MICECGNKTVCVDSRYAGGQSVRRRHRCVKCGARFSTLETINTPRDTPTLLTQLEIAELQRILAKVFALTEIQ